MIAQALHAEHLAALLAPVATLLADASVSEIMINGPGSVYAERGGCIERTGHSFPDASSLMAALRAVAQLSGRSLDGENPILEAHLPDGSRLEAVVPPAAPDGPIVSIRRFARSTLRMPDLVRNGSISATGAALLRTLVQDHQNLLIAGGTGSGKTSLLNALSSLIGAHERVVVIEDTRELQLGNAHVVQLEAQPPDARGRGAVSVRDLFCATLRLRPDRIVVGELRGREALELIQAMTSGHGGCMSTIHATTPRDALCRLETLALMSDVDLPLWALRAQIASAIHVVVQTCRERDGARHIREVCQVRATEQGYGLDVLYCGRSESNRERTEARHDDR